MTAWHSLCPACRAELRPVSSQTGRSRSCQALSPQSSSRPGRDPAHLSHWASAAPGALQREGGHCSQEDVPVAGPDLRERWQPGRRYGGTRRACVSAAQWLGGQGLLEAVAGSDSKDVTGLGKEQWAQGDPPHPLTAGLWLHRISPSQEPIPGSRDPHPQQPASGSRGPPPHNSRPLAPGDPHPTTAGLWLQGYSPPQQPVSGSRGTPTSQEPAPGSRDIPSPQQPSSGLRGPPPSMAILCCQGPPMPQQPASGTRDAPTSQEPASGTRNLPGSWAVRAWRQGLAAPWGAGSHVPRGGSQS
ncbi:hypothetical protein KIL84_017479 [Mauremys mutica]|uniref:Uncharacterized protein n=1 Tax=Mauremys mutica TaxID=74926 RepID=A0A9D4AYP4_9SAUR|nr:hypothetical protein KIL84_017479 [Mauremys mutica]